MCKEATDKNHSPGYRKTQTKHFACPRMKPVQKVKNLKSLWQDGDTLRKQLKAPIARQVRERDMWDKKELNKQTNKTPTQENT